MSNLSKWVCGFANAKGGKIFIGIDDKGNVTGVKDYKKLMDDIPNKVVSHLGLVADVNLHKKDAKHYLETVIPISSVPVSYHGIYFYRSGSTKQELKGAALNDFIMEKMGATWEQRPVPEATLKNIYTEEYLRTLDLNERQMKAVLYVKEHGQITNSEYQVLNGLKQTVSSQELQDLTKKNILDMQGSKGRGSKYVLRN